MSNSMEIYLITDDSLDFDVLCDKCEIAMDSGVKLLQYRRKEGSFKERMYEAQRLMDMCAGKGCRLIINDRVDIALAVGAHGVHLGQDDMDVKTARRLLGDNIIIGATAKTVDQAVRAFDEGADHLGVGALFPSCTKKDAAGISVETLKEIRKAVPIPVYGIGGITWDNLTAEIIGNIDGVAVVSAILRSEDVKASVERFMGVLA